MRRASSHSLASLTAALLALAFATPLRSLWATPSTPWWVVYLLWACAILVLGVLAHAARSADARHEPDDREREP